VNSCIWKKTEWKNAHKKAIGLHNWDQRGVSTKEEESLSIVEGGKRKYLWVYSRTIEKKIY